MDQVKSHNNVPQLAERCFFFFKQWIALLGKMYRKSHGWKTIQKKRVFPVKKNPLNQSIDYDSTVKKGMDWVLQDNEQWNILVIKVQGS